MNRDENTFSRSCIGGKKNSKVEARVTDELKQELTALWHAEGFNSESEFLELLIAIRVRGREHVLSMQVAQIDRVMGLSATSQTNRGDSK